ncbi:NPCBM/NEW2 domain-containing protein [Anaeromassilibacillus senegalensis]|uniref:NPCBM/NEW2 domain-containing protein n=1 Tax=Anaeromassilibacillus senegalensis TaxID=1673717 RepID=UPI0009E26B73|nr:NPCBM/NEW2 domain-containing protein [Anaeromassilibacillus senegalensis]
MKRRVLAMLLSLSLVATGVGIYPAAAAAEERFAPADAHEVQAPEKDLEAHFWLENGQPFYNVEFQGKELVEKSAMGLNTSIGDLNSGFTLTNTEESSGDEIWQPVVGEQGQIRDYYHQKSFELTNDEGIVLTLEMRAYDTGVAFRYVLPEVPQGMESYQITDEHTQFVFPAETMANAHISGNQTVPNRMSVNSFNASHTYQRPMTLQYPDGAALTICEANLDNYGVMVLRKDASTPRALKAGYTSYKPSRPSSAPTRGPDITVKADSPTATPWRTFVIGASEVELPQNSTIVENLNEAPDETTYGFSEWVDPGTCLRAASGMNTTAIKSIVDQAADRGIKYVLLDTGWYGPEFDVNCDPRLDPAALEPDKYPSDKILMEQYFSTTGGYNNTGEGVFNTRGKGFDVYKDLGTPGTFQTDVDIPAICDYANDNDVGIILYVNGVYLPDSSGRNRYGAEEIFTYFEKWGVKGVKPGFVHVRAQEFESYMQEVVAAAARHKLIMTVHDEYVPTGLQRTFPNLFCTEGILGDEGIGKTDPQVPQDIATLFTRTIQGPTDHTYCWPGKATKAYALASPLMFRTGMNVLYWYTNPNSVPEQDKDKMDFWKNMPTTWNKSLYLEGKMYEYATYARQSKNKDWYVGSLSAIERTLQVPLTFLDEGVSYVADIYADGADADAYAGWNSDAKRKQTLENNKYLVTSRSILERDLKYGFGYAVKLTPATEEDLKTLPAYNVDRERMESVLRQLQGLHEGDYTSDTWAVLAQAIQQAEALLNAPEDVSAEQYQQATAALQRAKEGLRSKQALVDAISSASVLTEAHYTSESWKVLKDALHEGERLLEEQQVSQEEIDQTAEQIKKAIQGLVKRNGLEVMSSTYLDNLDWLSKSSAHNNFIAKNKAYSGSIVLRINGEDVPFAHGVGTHAQSEIYYNIEGMGFEVFEATVGVSAAKLDEKMGNVIFRVYGDGRLLYETPAVGYGAAVTSMPISVPVAGVKELHLQADTNGANSGDHSNWADAKFVQLGVPGLAAISVDGTELPEFRSSRYEYFVPLAEGQTEVPEVTAEVLDGMPITFEVLPAQKVPGTTEIHVQTSTETLVYKVNFCNMALADYVSDLAYESAVVHSGKVYKDISYENNPMAVTAADGESEMRFEKGLGTHAPANETGYIVYNLEGKGYDRFQSWVGISYHKNDSRSTVRFRVFADNEPTARFDSGVMQYRTPAKFIDLDIRGVKKLRLEIDRVDSNAADHANWADAKFLTYEEIKADPQLLNVQWNPNQADVEIAGEADVLIDGNGIFGAKVVPGTKLTLTFTPADGPFASAQLNGEDIPFEADGCTYTFTMPNDKASLRFVFTSVSKGILETLLEKANEVTDEQLAGLVESVSKRFIAARNNAKAVYEDDGATQEEVNEAWKELLDAMHYLSFEEGTKDELEYWLDYAAMLDLDNFTPKSLEGYAEALAYAEEIYNDEGETLKAEVEKAAKNLQEAILRLEFKANTEVLGAFVQQAQEIEIDKYLDGPEKDKFNELFPQAEALLEDANATQKQVDEIADALYKAMMNLRMIPDKKVLKDLIDESEALNPDDYTEASYAILRAALNNAQGVYEDENATPEEITAVCATVEKARAGLVLADKPEEPAKPDNKPSYKPSNSGGKKPVGNTSGTGTAVAVPNPLINAVQNVMGQKSVRSDTTANFTLKRGSAYCFKMTVVNGSSAAPNFTVGNGNVLKTQFVAKVGNDYYYRVWAVGTPGQSTGVYTTMAGEKVQQHCVVTVG